MAAPLVAVKLAATAVQSKGFWKFLAGLLVAVLAFILTPIFIIVLTVLIIAGSANASCAPGNLDGYSPEQTAHVQTVVQVGTEAGVSQQGIVIAVAVMLVETNIRNLASSNVPGSEAFGNDGVGSDHDSLGLFQQRPAAGWGDTAELMTPEYAARAFFGGANGPNSGSPRGLLDIPEWENMEPGAAAQAVQVSAFPDRYAARLAEAQKIVGGTQAGSCVLGGTGELVGDKAFPIARGSLGTTYVGHDGVDFPAPQGTPIYAVADGVVTFAGPENLFGGETIFIRHEGNVMTNYIHMHTGPGGIMVRVGDQVKAGQQIGEVGSTGKSSGPHLHFEVALDVPPGVSQTWSSGVAPYRWLKLNQIAPGDLRGQSGELLVDDLHYTGTYNR